MRDAETRALLESGEYPCRDVDQNMADLSAQIAANATGVQELENYGTIWSLRLCMPI